MKTEQEIIKKCLSLLRDISYKAEPNGFGDFVSNIYDIDKVTTLLELLAEEE